MRIVRPVIIALVVVVGATVPASTQDKPGGYLAPGEFDVIKLLKPAPKPGDPRYQTDRSTFLATRKMEDTPRWKMAAADADNRAPAMLSDYSCAVGVTLTPQNSSKLLNVVTRAGIDTAGQASHAKELFERQRPFEIDKGTICQPVSDLFDKKKQRTSYDYPSGHAAWGWTWALVLSAIAPDRAQQIQQRAKAYGDSRVICGVHNASSIEAGMKTASATMAIVSTKPAYKADLAAARAELAALRAGAQTPQACDAEGALIAQPVMPKLDHF